MSKKNGILVGMALLPLAFSTQYTLAQSNHPSTPSALELRKDINHYDRTDEITDFRRIHWGKQYDEKGTGVVSGIAVEIHIKPDESPVGVLYVNTFDTDIRGFRETSYGPPDFRTKYTGVLRCNDSPYKFSTKNGESKTGKLFSGARLSVKEFRGGVENECYEYLFRGRLRFVDDNFYYLASTLADEDRLMIRLAGTKSIPNIDLSPDHVDDLIYMIKQSRRWLETNQPEFVANAYDEQDERQQRARIAQEVMNSAKQRYESFKGQYEFIKKREEEHQQTMQGWKEGSLPRMNLGYESEGTDNSKFNYNRHLPKHLAKPESAMVADARRRMEQALNRYSEAKREYEKWTISDQGSNKSKLASPEEVGIWKCTAGDFLPVYQLNNDGTFQAYLEKNGPGHPLLEGDWTRDGARIVFKTSGENAAVANAKLEGNGFRLNGFEYKQHIE